MSEFGVKSSFAKMRDGYWWCQRQRKVSDEWDTHRPMRVHVLFNEKMICNVIHKSLLPGTYEKVAELAMEKGGQPGS